MSYTKHNYKKGDELLASQLNDMDDQIALNEQTADTLVTVSNTQPSAAKNRVWVKATPSEIEIPTMDDHNELSRHLNDKAPVTINTASGDIASFADGADGMQIRKIVATIEPVQSGTGDPSPVNKRPISGWTQANIYNEETYDASATPKLTINWQTKAGTIYGGTVTLNEDGSADVVGDRIVTVFDGVNNRVNTNYISNNWIRAGVVYVSNALPNTQNRPIYCDKLAYHNGVTIATDPYSLCCSISGSLYIIFQLTQDAEEQGVTSSNVVRYVNNWLSNNPVTVSYKIRTPQTYHFDNIGQLKTFLGTNNVWCDTGDITELVYPVDTTAAIDAGDAENASAISTLSGSLATVETTSTSSKAYAIDDLLVYNSQLYKVASVIAAGGTLTPGTNITDTTVEEQIAEVKTELDKDIADVQAQISNVAGLQVLDWETIGYSYSVTSGGHKVSRNGNHIRTGETGTTTTGKWVVNLFGGNISIISNSSSVNGAILASEKLPLPTIASDSDVEIVIHEKWQSRVSGGYRRPPYIYVATVSSEDVVERMDITWSSTSLEGDYFKSYSLRKQLPSAFTNGNIVLCMGVNNAECLTDVWFDVHIVHTQT